MEFCDGGDLDGFIRKEIFAYVLPLDREKYILTKGRQHTASNPYPERLIWYEPFSVEQNVKI